MIVAPDQKSKDRNAKMRKTGQLSPNRGGKTLRVGWEWCGAEVGLNGLATSCRIQTFGMRDYGAPEIEIRVKKTSKKALRNASRLLTMLTTYVLSRVGTPAEVAVGSVVDLGKMGSYIFCENGGRIRVLDATAMHPEMLWSRKPRYWPGQPAHTL